MAGQRAGRAVAHRGPAEGATLRTVARPAPSLVDREPRVCGSGGGTLRNRLLGRRTPNPCIECNPQRLAALLDLADELGLARVATGHYARLVWRDGEPYVARGVDRGKDRRTCCGRYRPPRWRASSSPRREHQARDEGGRRGGRPARGGRARESEICFATEGYRRFFAGRGVKPRRGAVVDRDGRRLGAHDGQWCYPSVSDGAWASRRQSPSSCWSDGPPTTRW